MCADFTSRGILVCLILVLFPIPVVRGADIREVDLTIGEGVATVREMRVLPVRRGEQVVYLGGIPREADLSTLELRSHRVDVRLLEWGWENPDSGGRARGGEWERKGSALEWTRHPAAEFVPPLRRVRCVVESPVALEALGLDVIYETGGLGWSADYQIVVRGAGGEEAEPVSVDLFGQLRITNATARAYSNAGVRVMGSAAKTNGSSGGGPGFLMLDFDDPLADLWREKEPEPVVSFEYALPRRVNVDACAVV